jgi:hypothetical protein
MEHALSARTLGARYVRALMDQARFARGLAEPPEPIVTGNAKADAIDISPHALESYDALFDKAQRPAPQEQRESADEHDADTADEGGADDQ